MAEFSSQIPRPGPPLCLRWSVLDPSRPGLQVDVEVQAPRGTPWAVLVPHLAAVLGPGRTVAVAHVDGFPAEGLVAGSPPLVHGAIITLGRRGGAPGRADGTAGALRELQVVAGPDAGRRWPLPAGVRRLGRGPGVDFTLDDPEVSRVQAQLDCGPERITVTDLGSTNGTTAAGTPLGPIGEVLAPGTPVEVGGSRLLVRTAVADDGAGGPAAVQDDGGGRLLVNPAPRLPPVAPEATIALPTPPVPGRSPRMPWLAVLLPLAVSVPLVLWLHQPLLLGFALASIGMVSGQHMVDRRQRHRDEAAAHLTYETDRARAAERLAEELDLQARQRHHELPDAAIIATIASGPAQRVWERQPSAADHLRLRLGRGTLPATVTFTGGPAPPEPADLVDVPVAVDLPAVGVLGVSGSAHARRGLVRSLIGQAATLHSPRGLRVVVRTAQPQDAGHWAWTAWLPHAQGHLPPPTEGPVTGLRTTVGSADPRTCRVLVVLDGAETLRRDPAVAHLLRDGPAAGVCLVCLDDVPARLPAECGAHVDVATGTGRYRARSRPDVVFVPDLVGPGWAAQLGRDLARLVDATPGTGAEALPQQVSLLDLVPGTAGQGLLDVPTLLAGWADRRTAGAPATTATVGACPQGPWRLDLARDGPHAVIAGTTGSGKSELLLTLAVALALEHPPEGLAFVLVDYKGGTAFGPLIGLPHVVGVLTDLDAALARRALASLRAELRRRERLFRRVGAAELEQFRRLVPDEPVPRLVILVDEFRALVEDLPELLTGLVQVASLGRSLGVHLVLATQRPAGVVSAEIRANVNLRIALRVRDRADSEDVVDSPAAAEIPAVCPGRGVYRVGGGPLVSFQAAGTGIAPQRDTARVTVRPVRIAPDIPTAWLPVPIPAPVRAPAQDPGERTPPVDRLGEVVALLTEAADAETRPRPRPPWAPPLPTSVDLAELSALSTADPPEPPGALRFALTDLPEEQRHGLGFWDPRTAGHLGVVGAPGSGRSTVLRTLAAAALTATDPWAVHVIGDGSLSDLGEFPTLGTQLPVHDLDRAALLLDHLRAETRDGPGPDPADPRRVHTLVLVDGWEQVVDAWQALDHGRLVEELLRLARQGPAAGVALAVTGGRALLSGPLGGLLTERLFLRPADPGDLLLAGIRAADLPAGFPPGRGLRLTGSGPAVLVQVARWTAAAAGPEPVTCAGDRPRPLRIRPLPEEVSWRGVLPVGAAGPDGQPMIPIGVGGPHAGPLGPPATGPGWAVLGPPGARRCTVLAVAGRVLLAGGRSVIVVAAAPSPLVDLEQHGATVIAPEPGGRSEALRAVWAHAPRATVIIQDGVLVSDPFGESALLDHLDAVEPDAEDVDRPRILVGTGTGQAAVTFHGLVARLRTVGAGVLIGGVGPGDGEALGITLGVRPPGPPGRALLILPGGPTVVQVADPR